MSLLPYFIRVSPAFFSWALFIALIPRAQLLVRTLGYILLFVSLRDAMTPEGLWSFSPELELRFVSSALTQGLLALMTLGMAVAVLAFEPELRKRLRWWIGKRRVGVAWGFGLGAALALPGPFGRQLALKGIMTSPGAPAYSLWPTLVLLAYCGNFLEELLFRGFLQGELERAHGPRVAMWVSAVAFASFHATLITSVTNWGWPVLIFTFLEGAACAWLRRDHGLVPAVLAHGTAIFLYASGLS